LSGITIPTDALLCNQSNCPNHDSLLEDYYQDIVNCLSLSAASVVPTQQVGFQKFWWSEELDSLKAAAIEATDMWRHIGCRRSGPVNANRLQCKYKHKERRSGEWQENVRFPHLGAAAAACQIQHPGQI